MTPASTPDVGAIILASVPYASSIASSAIDTSELFPFGSQGELLFTIDTEASEFSKIFSIELGNAAKSSSEKERPKTVSRISPALFGRVVSFFTQLLVRTDSPTFG